MKELLGFMWAAKFIVGIHLDAPYLELLVDMKATQSHLLSIFPQLYKELTNPPNAVIDISTPALPSLSVAWRDPLGSDPPYPKEQCLVLEKYLREEGLDRYYS